MASCSESSSAFPRWRFGGGERRTPTAHTLERSDAPAIDDPGRHGAKSRPWPWQVSAGGAGAVVAVLLTTGSVPTASAQVALADWLSQAAVHVSDIHKAENAAFAVIAANGPIDGQALGANCGQLHDANEALRGVGPAPDSNLTAEVQQAIDNFDSASQSCSEALGTGRLSPEFISLLQTAEQHFSNADTLLVALAKEEG